jgi:hypothetical protein
MSNWCTVNYEIEMSTKFKLSLITIFLSAPLSCSAAATFIEFDTPYIFAEIADGKINGYYGLSLPEAGGRPSVSCEFFITSDSLDLPKHNTVKIRTFYTEGSFDKRDGEDVLPGELVVQGDKWTLQMDQVPDGCLSAAGGGFLKGSAVPNIVRKRTPIIGIFVINKKIAFFDLKGNVFVERKGFLVPGDAVIAYLQKNNFYFVRYLNTETSAVTEGWVPTQSITDPFPR